MEDVAQPTGAIRESDRDRLDMPPANLEFREFDVFLARMRDRRSCLKQALKGVRGAAI